MWFQTCVAFAALSRAGSACGESRTFSLTLSGATLSWTEYRSAALGEAPPIVHECAKRLRSRFYSVDVVQRIDGGLRVVEVGDGQVSDLVGWTPEQFVSRFTTHFSHKN
ncbi:MAG: ATP-grasp domain-containing protein [Verrucomicrobiota bacterium]